MRYSPSEIEELIEEVERQGGALLPDPCFPHKTAVIGPKKPKESPTLCGCGNTTRLVSIYGVDDDKIKERGGGFVTACAVCDNMGLWPRYQGK